MMLQKPLSARWELGGLADKHLVPGDVEGLILLLASRFGIICRAFLEPSVQENS